MLHTKLPLIFVTYEPADDEENEHDPVTVPLEGRVRLAGQDAERPEGAETARLTGPESPKRLVRVTVPVAEEPALIATDCADML